MRTYVVDTFEGRYHGVDVAGALHAAVDTAVGQLNEYLQQQCAVDIRYTKSQIQYTHQNKRNTNLLHWLVVVLGINEISAAKFLS